MWLDAVVTSADLQKVVDQLTPATVPLGSRGHLFFDTPAEVSLVAERGLRIRCHAKLLWPLLGMDVAVTVRSMELLVVPSVESRAGERVLVFTPEVDALDLALLPDIGDDEVRAFINRELQEKRIELPWNYHHTLDHQFALPQWFSTGRTFDIRSNGAAVKVTNDSIGLAIGLSASVEPNEGPGQAPSSEEGRRGKQNGAWTSPNGRSKSISLARGQPRRGHWLRLGLALASGFGMGCLVGLRQASR
jgi:hypothetical protein